MSVFHKCRPQWQQTMLRIKSPKATIAFYRDNLGFTLLDEFHFPKWNFSLYFMATLEDGGASFNLTPGTQEAHDYIWNFKGATLEFTHNHDSDDFVANNGNVEPHRGFGHVAVLCDDVYASCAALEKNGVGFQKKPDEGRMKGLAFAVDPDGYWVEVVKRTEGHKLTQPFNYAQTMMRVKDGKATIDFYCKYFGMTLLREAAYPDAKFTNYFLGQLTDDEKKGFEGVDPTGPDAKAFVNALHNPILELTYNHGTEAEEGNVYHNGNTDPKGFGHIGYLVDDIDVFCKELEAAGVPFQKKLGEGGMKFIAFALDPTGYWIEIVPRGMKIPQEFLEA